MIFLFLLDKEFQGGEFIWWATIVSMFQSGYIQIYVV